jgi:hypothetical protein
LAGKRIRWLVLGCVAVITVIIGVSVWLVAREPAVNQAQAKAMLPVVEAYLSRDSAFRQAFGSLNPQLKPRVFCDARILEISPDGPRWRVGMIAKCGQFARRDNSLIEGGSGYPGVGEVMILSGHRGHYHVLSLDVGPPYYDPAWVHRNFSSDLADQLLSPNPPTAPDPVSQARQAFGFPPGTRAVQV